MTAPVPPGEVAYWAEWAWLPGGPARDVTLTVADGRFVAVTPGTAAGGATRLPGVVLPGFADVHGHAFHRALRGRNAGGDFWAWRDGMYAVAGRLDPDSYHLLARAAYAELALAGVTTVGEFHYLHHGPGGVPYADPNAMGRALAVAAAEAGVRLTLLDTCYLAGGLTAAGHTPLAGVQRRFGDGSAGAWAERVSALRPDPGLRIGAAIHSVRAVPAADLPVVAGNRPPGPLHVHLSEQPAENEACLAVHGRTPTALLEDAGVLGPDTTAVHATHLTDADVALLASTGTGVCLCPTTEADLADGIGPAAALHAAGVPLSLGTDQHVTADLLLEARSVEYHTRLATGRRGTFPPAGLLAAATAHPALGWPDAGRLAPGHRADLVAVRLDTPRTAGTDPTQVLLTATTADIDTVLSDGRPVVRAGHHVLGDVAHLLQDAITPLWT